MEEYCPYCDFEIIATIEQAIKDNDEKHTIRTGWTDFDLDEEGKKNHKKLIEQLLSHSIETLNGCDRLFIDGSWWNDFWKIREKSKGVPAFNYCPKCGRKLY